MCVCLCLYVGETERETRMGDRLFVMALSVFFVVALETFCNAFAFVYVCRTIVMSKKCGLTAPDAKRGEREKTSDKLTALLDHPSTIIPFQVLVV